MTPVYVKLSTGDHINLATAWLIKQYPDLYGQALQIWYSENQAILVDDPEDVQSVERALGKLR